MKVELWMRQRQGPGQKKLWEGELSAVPRVSDCFVIMDDAGEDRGSLFIESVYFHSDDSVVLEAKGRIEEWDEWEGAGT